MDQYTQNIPHTPNTSQKIQTGVGPMTDNFINSIIDKINSDNFKKNISDKLLDPLSLAINQKIQPYVQLSMVLYGVVIVLMVVIIYLLLVKAN